LDRFKTAWAWPGGALGAAGRRVGGWDRRGGRSAPRPSRRPGRAAGRRPAPPLRHTRARFAATPRPQVTGGNASGPRAPSRSRCRAFSARRHSAPVFTGTLPFVASACGLCLLPWLPV